MCIKHAVRSFYEQQPHLRRRKNPKSVAHCAPVAPQHTFNAELKTFEIINRKQ
jgi:hypothetical protein